MKNAKPFERSLCAIANSLDILGDKWSLLVVRDLFHGKHTYGELADSPEGIPTNLLADRLKRLESAGIITSSPYQERPLRHEYQLTDRGLDLWPVIVELMHWGDRYAAPAGPPTVLRHRVCGGELGERRQCMACGAYLAVHEVYAEAGSGAVEGGPWFHRAELAGNSSA